MIIETCSKRKDQGFVLIFVLWMLAILSLLVASLADVVEDLQTQVYESQQAREERFGLLGVQETLLYLASVKSGSVAGLRLTYDRTNTDDLDPFMATWADQISGNELGLDGRVYLTKDDYLFSLQDAGSLISLRSENTKLLTRLIASARLSRAESNVLIANLKDYVDRDEDRRIDGAEKKEYLEASYIEPTNRFLTNPWQLNNVMGWGKVVDRNPDFLREVSIYPFELKNYNSMTKKRMLLMDGSSNEVAENIVNYREKNFFRNWQQVQDIAGNLNSDAKAEVNYLASHYLRIRLSKVASNVVTWLSVTLTPRSKTAPWEIDYQFVREIEEDDREDFTNAREVPPYGIYR